MKSQALFLYIIAVCTVGVLAMRDTIRAVDIELADEGPKVKPLDLTDHQLRVHELPESQRSTVSRRSEDLPTVDLGYEVH
jgi:hypothetical protein